MDQFVDNGYANFYQSSNDNLKKRNIELKGNDISEKENFTTVDRNPTRETPKRTQRPEENDKLCTFKSKKFHIRPSPLSPLLEDTALRTVPNMFLAIFLLMTIKAMIEDFISYGNPFTHLWLVAWNFKYFPETMLMWFIMTLSILIPYYSLKMWSECPKAKVHLDYWAIGLIFCYLLYLIVFFSTSVLFIFRMRLNCACTFIMTCEGTRIAMKVHSFIRENIYRAVRTKETLYSLRHAAKKLEDRDISSPETLNQDPLLDENLRFPTVKQLYYYFFCPAFIYRDEYPRNESVNWNHVLNYFLQIITVILFVNLIFTQMIYPNTHYVDYSQRSFGDITVSVFVSILPGFLCLLSLFYGLLHCWLNMFAEMLRFGDRQFYLNWWTSRNMAEYYRNWNLVVHDWLYAYIYRDVALLSNSKNGLKIAQTVVFFTSAFFHEYWFGLALRMFYPVMFVLYFVFGGIFFFISKFIKNQRIWNVVMWANLLFGTGVFVALYSQEWYARVRCPPNSQHFIVDLIKPRHWFCNQQINNITYSYQF